MIATERLVLPAVTPAEPNWAVDIAGKFTLNNVGSVVVHVAAAKAQAMGMEMEMVMVVSDACAISETKTEAVHNRLTILFLCMWLADGPTH